MKKHLLPMALASAAWLMSGCTTSAPIDSARIGPFFRPANVAGLKTLGGIRRVLVMPVCSNGIVASETEAALDPIFRAALQNEDRFEVVGLDRIECRRRFRSESLPSVSVLPRELISILKRDHAADAVLFVDITAYHAYRPISLGVRGKLMRIDEAGLAWVWAFDHVFAADNPAVANSARKFFLRAQPDGNPADMSQVALVSPRRFAAYVAAAMFATIPPVTEAVVGRAE